MDENLYYIWWIDQDDCDLVDIFQSRLEELPKYLQDQFWYRNGRAGRGRLWVPDDIPVPKIEWDDTSPIASYAERAGGIVFHAKDLPSVKRMIRGRVTDLNMKPVSI
jgi:hypothetical protein